MGTNDAIMVHSFGVWEDLTHQHYSFHLNGQVTCTICINTTIKWEQLPSNIRTDSRMTWHAHAGHDTLHTTSVITRAARRNNPRWNHSSQSPSWKP
jgi:hypothetical protein